MREVVEELIDDGGQRIFANLAHFLQVLTPALGFRHAAEGEVGFAFSADERRVANRAGGGERKDAAGRGGGDIHLIGRLIGGLTGRATSRLPLRNRLHLHNGVARRQVNHGAELTWRDTLQTVAQFSAK